MNEGDRIVLAGLGQHKITLMHLQLLACVYVRQSSLKQVLHNQESQFNQYQLVQRAEALGWKRSRIRVIDVDLGLSGQETEHRTGFKELVVEVSLGHVGIIFGYEVSRLARNNSDWYHLLDLAAMFGTLIADNDGVYDPRLFNDRLLLGLKGTMSEAELHLIQQRLVAGRLSQVRRGAYQQRLPTGLVRLEDGTVVKDPDEQVRDAIELVLTKFMELGSCQQVTRYCRQADILLPRRQIGGPNRGQIMWRPAKYDTIYSIILNPAYAGTFAYGRRQKNPTRGRPGRPSTGMVDKPIAEWIHLQQDVYPAYISWTQYLANQDRLNQNATRYFQQREHATGAPRQGPALLQGLVQCGRCGYRMQVDYRSTRHYRCSHLANHAAGPMCATIHATCVDEVVVQSFFEAIRPAQLDVLDAMLTYQQQEQAGLEQQWQQRLKRAEYEVHLAQRQYDAVDPDNRLVAGELERRWEEKLVQLYNTREAYTHFQQKLVPTRLTPELRGQFQQLSQHLPELWAGGTLSNEHKKELLRNLIEKVILTREKPDTITIKIVWVSGHYSLAEAYPPLGQDSDIEGYEVMIEQIGKLWQQGLNDEQIATQLTAAGFRSAQRLKVLPTCVQRHRLANGWYHPLHQTRGATEFEGRWTCRGLAEKLGVSQSWVKRRIQGGQIPGKHVTYYSQIRRYLIDKDPELMTQLRQLASKSRKRKPTDQDSDR